MSANSSLPDRVYLGGVRVLLVDSSPCIRAVVSSMLEQYGATVTAVETADEALEVLERERPEVLVSALAMPDKGGYWLIGKVRGLPPERGGATPAAALTGFTGPETGPVSCAPASSTTSRSRSPRTTSPGSSHCSR